MKLNPNFLNIQMLKARNGSVRNLASPENSLKETDDNEAKKIAGLLKTKVFYETAQELADSNIDFKYNEDYQRLDESKVQIGTIEVKNEALDFSCDVCLSRYENGVLSLSISPDEACSSFDFDISKATHNANQLNDVMEQVASELFDYFEADLLYIDDSSNNQDLPADLGSLADKVAHSQFIKLRSQALPNFKQDEKAGVTYNEANQVYTGKLGNYPFARNDQGYYSSSEPIGDYYKSIGSLVENAQIQAITPIDT